jgi:hypothetical protein
LARIGGCRNQPNLGTPPRQVRCHDPGFDRSRVPSQVILDRRTASVSPFRRSPTSHLWLHIVLFAPAAANFRDAYRHADPSSNTVTTNFPERNFAECWACLGCLDQHQQHHPWQIRPPRACCCFWHKCGLARFVGYASQRQSRPAPIVRPSLKHADRGAEMTQPSSQWLFLGFNGVSASTLSTQAWHFLASLLSHLLLRRVHDPACQGCSSRSCQIATLKSLARTPWQVSS